MAEMARTCARRRKRPSCLTRSATWSRMRKAASGRSSGDQHARQGQRFKLGCEAGQWPETVLDAARTQCPARRPRIAARQQQAHAVVERAGGEAVIAFLQAQPLGALQHRQRLVMAAARGGEARDVQLARHLMHHQAALLDDLPVGCAAGVLRRRARSRTGNSSSTSKIATIASA